MHQEDDGAEGDGTRRLLLCIGLGSLLCVFAGGPFALACFSWLTSGVGSFLVSQSALLLGVACSCMIVRGRYRRSLRRQAWIRLSYLGAALALPTAAVLHAVVSVPSMAAIGVAVLLGACLAWPMLSWFDALLALYGAAGRGTCIAVLAGSEIVAMLGGILVLAMDGGAAASVVAAVACVALSFACHEAQALLSQGGRGDRGGSVCPSIRRSGEGSATPPAFASLRLGSFRLTAQSISVLTSCGVSWGLAFGLLSLAGARSLAGMLAGAVVCIALALLCRLSPWVRRLRFGLLIRLSIVATGTVLAAVPMFSTVIPGLLHPLCQMVLVFQAVALNLFALELCHEKGAPIELVWSTNFLVFSLAAVSAAALLWALSHYVGGHLALDCMVLVAAAASLLVVPLLPSKGSDAATFTLERLPEEEDWESRVSTTKESLAQRFGLSDREREVLDLLVRGKTREEMAEALSLSVWTVKDYAKAVYEKTGVHSAKELMALVAGGDPPHGA